MTTVLTFKSLLVTVLKTLSLGVIWGWGTSVWAQGCTLDPDPWADALLTQLPLFTNLELARVNAEFRMILVSLPEIDLLSTTHLQALGVPKPEQEEAFILYFSTLERRMNTPRQDTLEGRTTDSLRLYYRAYVTRPRSTPKEPWQLFSLQVKRPGHRSRDISQGAVAQGIRTWQTSGCP
jgi:hypothetical protein